ncbi:hypothetical protein BGZ96_004841 [Linnemannia gamsii]|uniref:HCP-like protein n=1 Tax=Linnemannia gamsii TaxID=64522 RepID=A0ABQ7JHR8_9FUNG|nr:hypothetical protein BGZ96_004841 [Linnemannia gamsii]
MSVGSLQQALPDLPQEHSSASSNNLATNTIRRNPAYGLIEEALVNYTHIDNPATAPDLRGPQSLPDSDRPDAKDKISKPVHTTSRNQSQAPQGVTSGRSNDSVEIMVRARLGEMDAQVALTNIVAAEQGSAEAQRNIGSIYDYGKKVTQDHNLAFTWYRKSADQGYSEGQRYVGYMYEYGRGVDRDYGKAMEWYLKAADQGDVDALCHIGSLYDGGLGVPQDGAQVVDFYRKAAEQGDSNSQFNLGNMYRHGRCVLKDKAKAI